MKIEHKNKTMNSLQYSELESTRFCLNVHRGVFDDIDARSLGSYIIKNKVDVTILRIPSEKQESLTQLERLGFPYLVADTLVYYYVDLRTYEPRPQNNSDLQFVPFNSDDNDIMNQMVEEIFSQYRNHYTSNSLLRTNLIEGYKEWVRGYAEGVCQDKLSWLVKKKGEYIGFATCTIEGDEAEGVLYGVRPKFSGGGVYGDIIKFTQRFFKQRGYASMKVSTQVNNYAVQKVWFRESFVMKKSLITIHINSLLTASVLPVQSFELVVSPEMVQAYGELTGDFNKLHFDRVFAREIGFDDCISHGIIVNALMTKFYGVDMPGDGTLFKSYQYNFLKPIYIDKPYHVVVSFPVFIEKKGVYKSVVKIYDETDSLCLFAYYDMVKR